MSTKISMTEARLDDPDAMALFLAPIPNGDRLAQVLAETTALSSRAYHDESETARFVASGSGLVTCFTVTEITIDQAEMIAAELLDRPATDAASFREAVATALGPTFDP